MDIDIDYILKTFNACRVKFILIGGMNFSLRHRPYSTFDVDLWIEDTDANRALCEQALSALNAEWGHNDADWGLTREKMSGWLEVQGVYSLNTPHGPIDVFRSVKGLGDWSASFAAAISETTRVGTPYFGLSDKDMLQCQLVLDEPQKKLDRIQVLSEKLQKESP